jgi:xanthine dehydrogenase accessory factor
MEDWLDHALELARNGQAMVLVTVAAARGSTPRELGSKMLVHAAGIAGSIGGGHLEFKAIEHARRRIGAAEPAPVELIDFALGPSLGQCCGGRLRLAFETLRPAGLAALERWRAGPGSLLATRLADGEKFLAAPSEPAALPADLAASLARCAGDPNVACLIADGYLLERATTPGDDLYLFGAGHVGRALVHMLAELPYRIRWFDGRGEMFPAVPPANVSVEISADPRRDVAEAPPGALYLVMTHSHALDFEICDHVMQRGDFAFLGLIGSASKRASFARRLSARGHSEAALERLVCPIGLPQIAGKQPAVIAVAVAGQLLVVSEERRRRAMPASIQRRHRG